MRESIYLFKSGFKPIWEDRRNINGGSWTFRVPKAIGPDFWTRIQLLAIGEKLQSVIDDGMCFFVFSSLFLTQCYSSFSTRLTDTSLSLK